MENISYGKIVLIGAGHVGSAILDSLLRMNLADEIVADLQRDTVGIFETERLETTDVVRIGRLGGMFAAIVHRRAHDVVERIHSIPHFSSAAIPWVRH